MKRKVYKMHGNILLKKKSQKYFLKYQTLSTNRYTTVHDNTIRYNIDLLTRNN